MESRPTTASTERGSRGGKKLDMLRHKKEPGDQCQDAEGGFQMIFPHQSRDAAGFGHAEVIFIENDPLRGTCQGGDKPRIARFEQSPD